MSLRARCKKVLEEAACVVGLYRHELPRARIYIIGVWGRGGKKSVRRAVIWFCLAKFAVMWMSQSAAPHHFTLWINKKHSLLFRVQPKA